jgi:short-subunit dehydrogenase
VHTVNPGFVETEGFPQRTVRRNALLRRAVIEPDDVAAHVVKLLERGPSETTIPRLYRVAGLAQALAPNVLARLLRR